ncbi:GNAT family N-acetyltransferase [Streptomyces sp. HF10]|uniref:GNAT family N-acetyltransferase n=1 Tax=Streptomyces sp. HF10 TaxID=2692233 RepID=UPI0013192876|nr:GNAT family N-acetyltransferase [Streptomyces sp. HF10]QHC32982.1 GNAT family N-acetyltransferase [Streptomyces sp. HF10]
MREEDIHGVSTVRVRGWQAAYAGMVPQGYLDALTVAEDARLRRDMFERATDTVLNLVAEEDGTVVGWAALGPSREDDREPSDGELLALYAAPDRLGTGIGRALMRQTLTAARERSFQRLVLWVLAADTSARRFYERAGFLPDGGSSDWPVDGVAVPEVRYARDLAPPRPLR